MNNDYSKHSKSMTINGNSRLELTKRSESRKPRTEPSAGLICKLQLTEKTNMSEL